MALNRSPEFKVVIGQIVLVPLCSSDRTLSNIPMKF